MMISVMLYIAQSQCVRVTMIRVSCVSYVCVCVFRLDKEPHPAVYLTVLLGRQEESRGGIYMYILCT